MNAIGFVSGANYLACCLVSCVANALSSVAKKVAGIFKQTAQKQPENSTVPNPNIRLDSV